MSEKHNAGAPVFSGIKDWAVFFGWIGGLIIIGGIVWSLTQPVRIRGLMRSANRVLSLEKDPRRLKAPLPVSRPSGRAGPLGTWYTLEDSGDTFFVFTILRDGILVLCGAQVSPEGKVVEIVPLSDHAKQVFDDISGGVIQTYIRRIEALGAGEEGP
ncbi:MAG: hypothetical protein LBG10_06830 [Treponema sp.]|jgi:hypothetical protein|nr:hypothetical protein [Treponema sp.]